MVATASGKNGTTTTRTTSKAHETLIMPSAEIVLLKIELIGTTPLVMGRFGPRAQGGIEDGQRGDDEAVAAPKKKREPRDPVAEFEDKRYRIDDETDGFPPLNLKLSMIIAGQRKHNLVGTKLKMAFNVETPVPGALFIPILAPPPVMRTDRVLVGGQNKSTSVTYRPAYWPWRMEPVIEYDATMIGRETILNLLVASGRGVGLGEWRVDHDGDFGRYKIGAVQMIV